MASDVKAAFHKSGLRWLEVSARCGRDEWTFGHESAEALFIDGLDRVSKKSRQSVMDMLGPAEHREHPVSLADRFNFRRHEVASVQQEATEVTDDLHPRFFESGTRAT